MPSVGVHFYLANRIGKKGLDRDKFFLGNFLPDLEHFMRPREELRIHPVHSGSEHWEREKLLKGFKDESLIEGIKLHFLVDDYVHFNYIVPKLKKFKGKGKPELIHYLVETAMDGVLGKKDKKLMNFYEEWMKRVDVMEYGKCLDKIFPKSKYTGERTLGEGLKVMEMKNYTNLWRIYKIKELLKKYNPFKKSWPSELKGAYLILLLRREIRKDLTGFLKRAEKDLKKKMLSF